MGSETPLTTRASDSVPRTGDADARLSPYTAIHAVADELESGEPILGKTWLVRKTSSDQCAPTRGAGAAPKRGRNLSAWPHWFRVTRRAFRKPVLYLLRSESVAGLAAAMLETGGRGVFCNDAEAFASRWQKGVQPAVPIWLANCFDGTPYDPATGGEAEAILRSALARLEADGDASPVYLSAHNGLVASHALSADEAAAALEGMYRPCASMQGDGRARVRLLGGGGALAGVLQAAALLKDDWDVDCEVWSCPSFTRLARDADAAEHWNMMHPLAPRRSSHLQDCLRDSDAPVVAVTGYPQAIAEQIRPFVGTRFLALGSEWGETASSSAQWIAAIALGAMAGEGDESAAARAAQALHRYGLNRGQT